MKEFCKPCGSTWSAFLGFYVFIPLAICMMCPGVTFQGNCSEGNADSVSTACGVFLFGLFPVSFYPFVSCYPFSSPLSLQQRTSLDAAGGALRAELSRGPRGLPSSRWALHAAHGVWGHPQLKAFYLAELVLILSSSCQLFPGAGRAVCVHNPLCVTLIKFYWPKCQEFLGTSLFLKTTAKPLVDYRNGHIQAMSVARERDHNLNAGIIVLGSIRILGFAECCGFLVKEEPTYLSLAV